MARFSADHFEDTADFIIRHTDNDFDPADLAESLYDLSRAEQEELWDIIESGDEEAFEDFCREHDIHYHG